MDMTLHDQNGDRNSQADRAADADPGRNYAPAQGGQTEPPPSQDPGVEMPVPGASYAPAQGGQTEPPPSQDPGVEMPVPGADSEN